MNVTETTRTFGEFFEERGHLILPGSSLVPENGAVLFTTAGMHPLTRYLEGLTHPRGRRLAGVQRCLRTTDLDEVGDDRHLTVFQMLGSWSLGDYDGQQSLRWGFEPTPSHRPSEVTTEDNWWSNGLTGPCGPDSEMFVWTGAGPPQGTPGTDERWMELWNHVMMRYRRHPGGGLEPLPQRSVDTGMGLERLLMAVQGKPSVFDTDVFAPWISSLPGLWQPDLRSLRLLADHLRASVVIVGDGVRPANAGRGYVLRRLLRRALTVLWREDSTRTLSDLPASLFDHTLAQFGQTADSGPVRDVIRSEEQRFAGLLSRGRKVLAQFGSGRPLTQDDLEYLHQTHGLPPDLVTELLS